MHAGGGDEQMERAVFEPADRRARFGRGDDQAIVDQLEFHHVRGARHRAADHVGVTLDEPERLVGRNLVPKQRRAWRERGRGIDHRRQGTIVHHHAFRRITRRRPGFGDDERDRIPDVAYLAIRQCWPRWNQHRTDRRDRRVTQHQPKTGDIRISENRSAAGIDPFDRRVRVWRTQDICEHLSRQVDVIDKSPVTGEETFVLDPARGLADERHGVACAPRMRRPGSAPVASPFRLTVTPETMVAS